MFPNVFTIVALNHHPQSAQHYLLLMYLYSNWSSCTWTLHGQQILHTPCYVYHNIVKSFTEQVHTRPATLSQIAVTSVLWINVTNKFLLCHQKELITILQHAVSFSKQNLRQRILLWNEFITPADTEWVQGHTSQCLISWCVRNLSVGCLHYIDDILMPVHEWARCGKYV